MTRKYRNEQNIIIHGVPEEHQVAKDRLQNTVIRYAKGLFEGNTFT